MVRVSSHTPAMNLENGIGPEKLGPRGNLQDLSRMFGALAGETRLRILNLLVESSLCVKDISRALALSQSNVSQNLSVLLNAGLVQYRREGASSLYYLEVPRLYQELVHCLRKSRESFPQLFQDLQELRNLSGLNTN